MHESANMQEAFCKTLEAIAKRVIPFDLKATCTTVDSEPVTLGEILESTGPATDDTPTGDTMPADDIRLANKVLQLNGLFDDEMMPGMTYAQVAERLADELGIDLAA